MKIKMKSIAVFMALIMVLSSLLVFPASAATVSYSATSVGGKKGETVKVYVKKTSDVDIWASNVMLQYNSSELEVVKCTKGDLISQGSLHDTGSSVNFSGTFSGKSGTVFIVEFKILKSSGTSSLKLTSTENIDNSGKTYTCTVSNGKVTVLDKSAVVGDANGDELVSAVDARVVLQAVAGVKNLTSDQKLLIDMNRDGSVTAVDARIILQKVAGLK